MRKGTNPDAFRMNLKKLIKERGLTQLELSIETGIMQTTISAYVTGRTLPTVTNLAVLAHAFGVTMDELMKGVVVFPEE